MPDRIIRAELLDSEAWLSLKDNADRVCWIAVFLTADVFGDLPAGPQRLMKLWRHAGIDTPEKVAHVKSNLADVDLIRTYSIAPKDYLHIPRYRQNRRYLGHVWPLSPWATIEEKQRFAKNSREELQRPQEDHVLGVGVGVGDKPKSAPVHKSVDKSPGKWWDTVETIKQKAYSLGLKDNPGESRDALYRRVRARLDEAKEKP